MRSLDLFSCIGAHALGFRRAGIETVAFCESSEWRRECLAERFPGAPIHDDVRTFRPIEGEIVIGGPPCALCIAALKARAGRDTPSSPEETEASQAKPPHTPVED